MPRRDQVSLRLAHGAEVFAFETDPFVAAQHWRPQPDLAISVAHLGGHMGDHEAAGLAGTQPAAQQAEGLGEERLDVMWWEPPRPGLLHPQPELANVGIGQDLS